MSAASLFSSPLLSSPLLSLFPAGPQPPVPDVNREAEDMPERMSERCARKLLYFEIPHPQRIGLHKRKAVRREKDSLLKTKPHIEYLLVRFLNFDILMPGNPASLPSQLVVDMLWNWYLGALW